MNTRGAVVPAALPGYAPEWSYVIAPIKLSSRCHKHFAPNKYYVRLFFKSINQTKLIASWAVFNNTRKTVNCKAGEHPQAISNRLIHHMRTLTASAPQKTQGRQMIRNEEALSKSDEQILRSGGQCPSVAPPCTMSSISFSMLLGNNIRAFVDSIIKSDCVTSPVPHCDESGSGKLHNTLMYTKFICF